MASRSVDLQPGIYDLHCVKTAAHALSRDCSFHLERLNGDILRITLYPERNDVDLEAVERRFHRELIDQELRHQIRRETEHLRDLIIAHAFSNAAFDNSDLENAHFEDDPLGIARQESRPSRSQDTNGIVD